MLDIDDSTTPELEAESRVEPGIPSSSMRERLAARARELREERPFMLPVIGFEDVRLCARYKVLEYKQLRAIGKRTPKEFQDTPEGEVISGADTLINACLGLYEDTGHGPHKPEDFDNGRYAPFGCSWGRQAAVDIFGLNLPDDTRARAALRAIMPDTELMLHFKDYDDHLSSAGQESAEVLLGETEPSHEG